MSDALVIMLVGFLVAVNSGITGSFMVLRKLSMIGDAISHAVLPGIIIAYMIAGHRENFFFLFGAAIMGVFVTLMIDWFNKKGRLPTDASIGLSFTFLFAVGIILISAFTDQVDIDADCVLFGEISLVPFHTYTVMGMEIGTKAMWDNIFILLVIIVFTIIMYRPLLITSFNEEYGQSIGIGVKNIRLFLMILVSLTTVFAFESVGAILVVAFLVIPPATAFLISKRLHHMLGLTVFLALASSVGGFYLADSIDGSIAGSMSVVAGLLFIGVVFGKRFYKKIQRRKFSPHQPV
ncbi:MAG: metal ABC transporter permease [Cryomorphaceae bacterium]|nr:metal ABC transporter permease [Cryomorphaceae bacterium]